MKTSGKVLAEQVKKIEESKVFSIRSPNLPTWCPGCGYFGIHQGLNNAIQLLGLPHHKIVVVSGIGCAGRYPFFTDTYGLHTAEQFCCIRNFVDNKDRESNIDLPVIQG